MNRKLIIIFLLFYVTFFKAYAGGSLENNRNFQNRFEYVTSFFDYVTAYEEDFQLSLYVVDERGKINLIVVGIKELYTTLYGEQYKSKEQLYLSVGKVFLRDTLMLDKQQLPKFNKFIVDKESLAELNKMSYASVLSKFISKYSGIANVDDKMRRAIICYFDRRWYPTTEKKEGDVVNFEYNFSDTNAINIYKGKELYIQIWDKNGRLISESPVE